MRVDRATLRAAAAMRAEDGVSMVIALMVMLVTSLLLVATFTAANGETHLSHTDLTQKQAYYAALAGVQEYEYDLEDNPDYWEKCPELSASVPGEASESYIVKPLTAKSDPESEEPKKCKTGTNAFKTMIESKGSLINTFRIESVGKSGNSSRVLIATFSVSGFLNYIYFTQFENQDPNSYQASATEKEVCAEHYRPERIALEKLHNVECVNIEFAPEDSVNGPMKTDDEADVCNGAEFGRKGHIPYDPVEIDLNVKDEGNCGGKNSGSSPVYNTESGKPTVGAPELVPPQSDSSLKIYVESSNEFSGLTYLELNGSTNKIEVTTFENGVEDKRPIEWPKNGLIYVQQTGSGCGYGEFKQSDTDTKKTLEEEKNCGSVYVKGTYSSSLTIAAENDVIVDGNIEEAGITPPAAPSSTTTMGLIATRYIRIYHPVEEEYAATGSKCKTYTVGYSTKEDKYLGNGKCEYTHNEEACDAPNASSSLTDPWIYAAILSTSHSFLVDNPDCGSSLSYLNIYGAIAQKYRGIVGTVGGSGYLKNYIYDERLATDEPPYFLAPLKAGWRIARLTAPSPG